MDFLALIPVITAKGLMWSLVYSSVAEHADNCGDCQEFMPDTNFLRHNTNTRKKYPV